MVSSGSSLTISHDLPPAFVVEPFDLRIVRANDIQGSTGQAAYVKMLLEEKDGIEIDIESAGALKITVAPRDSWFLAYRVDGLVASTQLECINEEEKIYRNAAYSHFSKNVPGVGQATYQFNYYGRVIAFSGKNGCVYVTSATQAKADILQAAGFVRNKKMEVPCMDGVPLGIYCLVPNQYKILKLFFALSESLDRYSSAPVHRPPDRPRSNVDDAQKNNLQP